MCNLGIQTAGSAFIGGSDARIIMGDTKPPCLASGGKKRGKVGPENFSTNLIVQIGFARISTPGTMPKSPDQTGRPNSAFPEQRRRLIKITHPISERPPQGDLSPCTMSARTDVLSRVNYP